MPIDTLQVDIRNVCSPDFTANQAYVDQINVSDILIGTKTDLATEEEIQAYQEFASELFPPKTEVGRISRVFLKFPFILHACMRTAI